MIPLHPDPIPSAQKAEQQELPSSKGIVAEMPAVEATPTPTIVEPVAVQEPVTDPAPMPQRAIETPTVPEKPALAVPAPSVPEQFTETLKSIQKLVPAFDHNLVKIGGDPVWVPGTYHRAFMVARAKFEVGEWDGKSEITIDNPYDAYLELDREQNAAVSEPKALDDTLEIAVDEETVKFLIEQLHTQRQKIDSLKAQLVTTKEQLDALTEEIKLMKIQVAQHNQETACNLASINALREQIAAKNHNDEIVRTIDGDNAQSGVSPQAKRRRKTPSPVILYRP